MGASELAPGSRCATGGFRSRRHEPFAALCAGRRPRCPLCSEISRHILARVATSSPSRGRTHGCVPGSGARYERGRSRSSAGNRRGHAAARSASGPGSWRRPASRWGEKAGQSRGGSQRRRAAHTLPSSSASANARFRKRRRASSVLTAASPLRVVPPRERTRRCLLCATRRDHSEEDGLAGRGSAQRTGPPVTTGGPIEPLPLCSVGAASATYATWYTRDALSCRIFRNTSSGRSPKYSEMWSRAWAPRPSTPLGVRLCGCGKSVSKRQLSG